MLLPGEFFYGVALLLIIYVTADIISTRKVTLSDAIAALGVIVSIVLALTIPPASSKESIENPIRDPTIIAGNWEGTIKGDTSDFSAELEISIQPGCSIGKICGTEKIAQTSCLGNLILAEIIYKTFYFLEESCGHGSAQITLFSNGTLSWTYQAGNAKSHATLSKK